ncbi:MAG: ATP-binding protein [Micrococcales bacterium]|nr:ATP-binding protein [Micrococcales bacterium]
MAQVPQSPLGEVLPRRAAVLVAEALADTRVVLVNGARQSGKSTLVAQIARACGAAWFSLDRQQTLQSARHDPESFVRQAQPMVIDEVQRAPELFLAIKELVDTRYVPGGFLLTGSSRVLALRGLPDTLPGRMETIELWPLSQGEIEGAPDGLVDALFAHGPEVQHASTHSRASYAERIVRGGFPEAVARTGRRRRRFHRSYVADLINRDIMQMSSIERGHQMRTLLDVLAGRSAQILSARAVAQDLAASPSTIRHYTGLLEEVFLVKQIPAWSRNIKTRATSRPKLVFVDSGVAASLLNQDEETLLRLDGAIGPLLEGFVAMEVARQCSWSDDETQISHYRTRDNVEVDLLLERGRKVVAIEVKASATVRYEDFRGLRHLAQRLGDDFVVGVVLHLGEQTLPFGDRMRAMPVSALWEVAR